MRTSADFEAPIWLANRHAQTIFPSTPLCRVARPGFRRELIELPDGDFVEADWTAAADDPLRPLVILLHGLEGSSESSYARMMMLEVIRRGWSGVVLHFRGCGGSSNRLPRRYHAGDTDDLRFFLETLRDKHPRRPILAIGYSLGGNVLLKFLGESADASPLDAAVAVSVPYSLHDSARALATGGARFYQRFLLGNMRRSMRIKYTPELSPFNWDAALRADNFYDFDDIVTAPLHGFAGADDYYTRSSSKQFLKRIATRALLIGALDDPFMFPESYPRADELSDSIETAFSSTGGHVGFVYGTPVRPRYWLPERISGFFCDVLGVGDKTEAAVTACVGPNPDFSG